MRMNGRRILGAKNLHGDHKLPPPPPRYPQHFPQYDPPDGRKPRVHRSNSSIVRDKMQHVWTQEAKQSKKWGLFLRAKKIGGYETAIESALKAAEVLFKSEKLVFDELDSLYGDGDNEEASFFFWMVGSDSSEALMQHASLVKDAAARGDVKFFKRICDTMRNAERRRKRDSLKFYVLIHWIASSLWLASDFAGSIYLRQVLKKKTLRENSYARARKRLGLKGYAVNSKRPFITGCNTRRKFIFSKRWTDLEPSLSR